MENRFMEVAKEFEGTITPGELYDVLQSFKTLKDASEHGKVIVSFSDAGICGIDLAIQRKPAPRAQAQPKLVKFPTIPIALLEDFYRIQQALWRVYEAGSVTL